MFENYKSILSVAEVAEELGISRSKVYRMVQQGGLPCIKIGKTVRFQKDELIKAFELMKINVIEEIEDGYEE